MQKSLQVLDFPVLYEQFFRLENVFHLQFLVISLMRMGVGVVWLRLHADSLHSSLQITDMEVDVLFHGEKVTLVPHVWSILLIEGDIILLAHEEGNRKPLLSLLS